MRFSFPAVLYVFAATSGLNAQTAAEHVAMGDRDYAAMDAPSALARYEKAIAADPESYDAQWRASRSAVDVGSYLPDASRRPAMYANAERYARKAVALRASDAEGHFSLARALGKTALAKSPRDRVKYGTEIHAAALQCLRIAPRHGGCLHVMGMWNAEIMRLNGVSRFMAKNFLGGQIFGSANWTDAVKYMEKSRDNDSARIVHRLDLARIYADVGNTVNARAEYQNVITMTATDFNDRQDKAEAAAEMKKLK